MGTYLNITQRVIVRSNTQFFPNDILWEGDITSVNNITYEPVKSMVLETFKDKKHRLCGKWIIEISE